MQRILFVGFLLLSLMVCSPPPAWAGGVDDIRAGVVAAAGGDYDKAIGLYTKAIASGDLSRENLSITYYNRGIAWDRKGDYDRAIADYTKAIWIDPQNASIYNNRGLDWYHRGDYDRAIADYTKAIWIDPQNANAYSNRGAAWFLNGDSDRAIADFTKAIEINPKLAEALNGLAWILAKCPNDRYRDGKRAVELAEKAVELQETSRYLDTLAAAYAETGRFQDAIKTQERAITKLKQEGGTNNLPAFEEHLSSYKAGKR